MERSEYEPMVSPQHAERIRRWHERAYDEGTAEAPSDRTFTYLGRTLVVPSQVQPVTGMSHLLGEAVLAEVEPGDRVLDMGTGCGVNAILAATESTRVVAVDINPHAIEAARGNVARNGFTDRVEVRHSDVFSHVEGVFDLIVFGSSGDLPYLRHLAHQMGLHSQTLARQSLTRDDWTVDYFTFRMTPRTRSTPPPRTIRTSPQHQAPPIAARAQPGQPASS